MIELGNAIEIRIIQKHEEGDRRRTHKKKRIDKKWLKRYGYYGKQLLSRGQIIMVDNIAYMSLDTFRSLKLERRNNA